MAGQKKSAKVPRFTQQNCTKKKLGFFFNFPHSLDIQGCVEISKNSIFFHRFACVNLGIKKLMKLTFTTIGGFTQYSCFNAYKWPQMLQTWRRTILFWSGHTLGTLKHGLGSLFYCFITSFGVGSSLDPPDAPWWPPGPPGAPLTPGMSSWTIVSHPGSFWVIFDPSGVNNSSVYTTIHCTALWCTVVHFWGVG